MYTKTERIAARKETNHMYYLKNHTKWGSFYPKTKASQVGTGNLGEHRNPDFAIEAQLIEKEMVYLGLRKRCRS